MLIATTSIVLCHHSAPIDAPFVVSFTFHQFTTFSSSPFYHRPTDTMFSLFSRASTSTNNTALPPTLHGHQGRTEFAHYLLSMPERKWDTDSAKFALYSDDNRVADLRQFAPPLPMRRILFDRCPFNVDLSANDLLNAFTGLDTKDLTCSYLTPCHQPLQIWTKHVSKEHAFYVCPYVDRKDFPKALASTSNWMFGIKNALEQSQTRLRGFMIVPAWDKSVFARMYLMTASGPAIILKPWISEVHVFHQVSPQRASLRNGSINISEGYVSDMPLVAILLDSAKTAQDPISFHDHHLGSKPVNWGLKVANIGRTLEDSVSVVRFDVHHNLLKDYYIERTALLADAHASSARATNFMKEDSRAFQGLINRRYGGLSDAASVNSKNAHFPMGGIKVRKSPHSEYTRFEWSMPHSLATELIIEIMKSPAFTQGSLFAIRLSDLGSASTFQVVPNRDLKREHKDVDAIEVHNLLARSDKGQQCGVWGAAIKNSTGMIYSLDVSRVEVTGDLPPLNSLANSLFFNTHLVMFRGASSELVQFWESKGMMQPQLSSIGPSSPWPKAKVEVEAPSPLVVEVAAPKEELLLNVKVVISLLGAWNEWNTVDAIAPSETLHRVTFVHEGSSALAQNFFLAGVRAKPLVPNPTLRATLLQQQHVEQGEDEPELVKTIQAGREFDSSVQVHSVMDAQKRLASKAMSSDERVGLLNEPPPPSLDAALATPPLIPEPTTHCATEIPGLFLRHDIFSVEEFDIFLDSINKSPGKWDTSTRRHKRDFGYELDRVGEIVGRGPPLPDACKPLGNYFVALGKEVCPTDAPEMINQLSVNSYAPTVGIGKHVDASCLGGFVGVASMGSGATILFTPEGRATHTHSVYMPARSALLLTGEARWKYAHSIDGVGSDIVNGEEIPRDTRHSLVCRYVDPTLANIAGDETPV